MKQLIVFSVIVLVGRSAKLPHNFKTCKRSQPDFDKCMAEAAGFNLHQLVHPYKEVKLPSLTPYYVASLVIGSGKSAVAVEQRFHNCSVFGIDRANFDKFELNFAKKMLTIDVTIPEIKKMCQYELNGKVLLLPIQGAGDSVIVIKNVRLTGTLPFEESKKKGKTHLHFISHHLSATVTNVQFHFDNLFNGDKQLGDGINKMLNDNWELVFEDIKDGYVQALSEIVKATLNSFWGRVSVEEALDN